VSLYLRQVDDECFDDYPSFALRVCFNSWIPLHHNLTDMTRLFFINPFYKNEEGKWRLRNPFILCRFGMLVNRGGKLEFRPHDNADDMHLDGAIELRFPIHLIPATYGRHYCSPGMSRIDGVEWKFKWPIQYYPPKPCIHHSPPISNPNLGMDVVD
jgi:hypothetical protein